MHPLDRLAVAELELRPAPSGNPTDRRDGDVLELVFGHFVARKWDMDGWRDKGMGFWEFEVRWAGGENVESCFL